MTDEMHTYGIEALAAATMGAPAHRLAVLAVIHLASGGHIKLTGSLTSAATELADWIDERDRAMVQPTPQDRVPGDDSVDVDLTTTETREGVRSFGQP